MLGVFKIRMEQKVRTEECRVDGSKLMEELKKIIHEGNVQRVVIKSKAGRTLLDMPLVVGAVGVLLLPFWAGVAAIVGLANEYSLVIERVETPASTSH